MIMQNSFVLSDVIENLYISKRHPTSENGASIEVQKHKDKYYLISGYKRVMEFMYETSWNYDVNIIICKILPDFVDFKRAINFPHATKDNTQDKKQFYSN